VLLQGALRRHASRVALETPQGRLTYADLEDRSRRIAGGLAELGSQRGDRVALLLRNSIAYAVADLAIVRSGLVKVPLNELLSKSDVKHAMRHSGASIVIVHGSLHPLLEGLTGVHTVVVPDDSTHIEGTSSFEDLGRSPPREPCPARPGEPAVIMYTGGTTGRPKGIVHDAGALGTNLLAHVLSGQIRDGEKMLLCTPLPHSAGFFLQAGLLQGATVHLATRFDPAEFLRHVEEHAISWTFMVPTMIYRLLDALGDQERETSSLETIVYGAAPIARARIEEALRRFGPVFLQLFGQSECPNFATTLAKEDHHDPSLLASCGQPCPGVEVRIGDEAGGELASGEVGEVLLRAPYTLREYHLAPELTDQAFFDDWLRTGDVGYQIPSGHLFLVDRKKDMIITGGMNVYSSEVEQVLHEHASIGSAAVVGVPDADWGEAVHAFFVPREGVEAAELIDFCRGRLAKYKVPKGFTPVEALPTTPYGKVDKKALRADWLRDHMGDKA
jgi:fatty-acyl-CoA synthase/long-chain acyl-CoA synthetase